MTVSMYDPSQNTLVIANYKVTGVVAISVQRGNPVSKTIGGISSLYSTRVKLKRRPFTLSVTVLQTSVSNLFLQNILSVSEQSPNSFIDIALYGTNGVVHIESTGYMEAAPNLELEETLKDKTYTFKVNPSLQNGVIGLIV